MIAFSPEKPRGAAEASVLHKVIELLLPQLPDQDRKTDIHWQKAESHFVDLVVCAMAPFLHAASL